MTLCVQHSMESTCCLIKLHIMFCHCDESCSFSCWQNHWVMSHFWSCIYYYFFFLYKEIGIFFFLLSNPSNMKLHMQCGFTASLKLAQVTTRHVASVQLHNSPSWNWLECTSLLWVMKTLEPFCVGQTAGQRNGRSHVWSWQQLWNAWECQRVLSLSHFQICSNMLNSWLYIRQPKT